MLWVAECIDRMQRVSTRTGKTFTTKDTKEHEVRKPRTFPLCTFVSSVVSFGLYFRR